MAKRKSSKQAALEREEAAKAVPADIIVNDSDERDDADSHLDAIAGEVVEHQGAPVTPQPEPDATNQPADVTQMITDYLGLRAAKSALTAKYEEKKAQIDGVMETIEDQLRAVSKQLNIDTFGSPNGTVYFSETAFVKVADKTAWVNWLGDSYAATKGMSPEQAANVVNIIASMLTTHTSKEAILEFMKNYQTAIPGIDVTRVKKLYVRKK